MPPKYLFSVFFILAFPAFTFSFEKEEWKELEVFHLEIALTFHPAEEEDFEPIRKDSYLLVEAAKNLLHSDFPSYISKIEKNELKESLLPKLVANSQELHEIVQKKKTTDQEIFEALSQLHSLYHQIEKIDMEAKRK